MPKRTIAIMINTIVKLSIIFIQVIFLENYKFFIGPYPGVYDVCDFCHRLIYDVDPEEYGKKILCEQCAKNHARCSIPNLKMKKNYRTSSSIPDECRLNNYDKKSKGKIRRILRDNGPAMKYDGKYWSARK